MWQQHEQVGIANRACAKQSNKAALCFAIGSSASKMLMCSDLNLQFRIGLVLLPQFTNTVSNATNMIR